MLNEPDRRRCTTGSGAEGFSRRRRVACPAGNLHQRPVDANRGSHPGERESCEARSGRPDRKGPRSGSKAQGDPSRSASARQHAPRVGSGPLGRKTPRKHAANAHTKLASSGHGQPSVTPTPSRFLKGGQLERDYVREGFAERPTRGAKQKRGRGPSRRRAKAPSGPNRPDRPPSIKTHRPSRHPVHQDTQPTEPLSPPRHAATSLPPERNHPKSTLGSRRLPPLWSLPILSRR